MADGQAAPAAREHAFDLATAVHGGPGSWSATVDPGWTIGDRPNGGYLLALATRAALGAVDHQHPLAVSCQFLAPPAVGAAELEVVPLRAGRSLSTARVTLLQDGRPLLAALVGAGELDAGGAPQWQRASGPPELPPVEQCVRAWPDVPGRIRINILDHLDIRLDPATAGSLAGRPSGRLEMRGWVRFQDGRPPDPLALLQAVDALPPTSFELGIPAWAPTVELTVYPRGLPAPGWLACVVRGQLWRGGWFDEDAEVWDASGRLVAQGRQLAGARPREGVATPGPS
jgi:acyl-CoA thioesterase